MHTTNSTHVQIFPWSHILTDVLSLSLPHTRTWITTASSWIWSFFATLWLLNTSCAACSYAFMHCIWSPNTVKYTYAHWSVSEPSLTFSSISSVQITTKNSRWKQTCSTVRTEITSLSLSLCLDIRICISLLNLPHLISLIVTLEKIISENSCDVKHLCEEKWDNVSRGEALCLPNFCRIIRKMGTATGLCFFLFLGNAWIFP